MEKISEKEFNRLVLKIEPLQENSYLVKFYEPSGGYNNTMSYDLLSEKVVNSDLALTEDQLDQIHDEVVKYHAGLRDYEPDPYKRYGVSENQFFR